MIGKRFRSTLLLVAFGAAAGSLAMACDSGNGRVSLPTPTATSQVMDKSQSDGATMEKPSDTMTKLGDGMMATLPEQQFAAHFVSSMPAHGAKLAQPPSSVDLTFNFTLGGGSTVTVTRDGNQVNAGSPMVSGDKLKLTAAIPSGLGAGIYVVDYKACWPDNSCHNGKLAFTVGT